MRDLPGCLRQPGIEKQAVERFFLVFVGLEFDSAPQFQLFLLFDDAARHADCIKPCQKGCQNLDLVHLRKVLVFEVETVGLEVLETALGGILGRAALVGLGPNVVGRELPTAAGFLRPICGFVQVRAPHKQDAGAQHQHTPRLCGAQPRKTVSKAQSVCRYWRLNIRIGLFHTQPY